MSNTTLISLTDATKLFPERQGRKPHLMTVKRWIRDGVNGVYLAAQKAGGVWFTKEQWVLEFIEACTRAASRPSAPRRSPAARSASHRKAEQELQRRYGINGATESQVSSLSPQG